jgi:hypothetical protein
MKKIAIKKIFLQVLQERDVQIQLQEIEKIRLSKLDAIFAVHAQKRDEEDFECDKEKVRMRQSQKLELRHHLDRQ